MTGKQRVTMLRMLKIALKVWRSALPVLAVAGMASLMGGCLTSCIVVKGPPPEVDLFDPEIVKMMIKEPVIIPGMVLYMEITAGGSQVVPGGQKIVSLRGDIVVPLVPDPVDCTDLTLRQLTDKLTEAYEVLYKNPSVTVMFASGSDMSPWGTVGIYGCVGREGRVPLPSTSQLSLTQAIQLSGGPTPLANRKRIQVTRIATPKDLPQLTLEKVSQTKEFSYADISSGIIPDPQLLKDDVVRVPETFL